MHETPDDALPRSIHRAGQPVRVVQRGRGRMLQVGGTNASWFQPGRLITGSVWDALALPVLALPEERRRALLVLGLGGGSAAHLLRACAPDARIVGVELEPAVVAAARASFELDRLDLEIRIGDARDALAEDARWDLVLEDCFVGDDGDLSKPRWLLEGGLERAADRLTDGGVLVCDAIHEGDEIGWRLRQRFASVIRIELEDCTNQVFVATDRVLDAKELRARARSHRLFERALGNLTFRTLA